MEIFFSYEPVTWPDPDHQVMHGSSGSAKILGSQGQAGTRTGITSAPPASFESSFSSSGVQRTG